MMHKPTLKIGLIGSGFMGRAHAFGYAMADRAFDLPCRLELHTLADATKDAATKAADALGFPNATADWRAMVTDPAIDIVNITTPNTLHKEMALAAIAAGKHVYCEKPLAPTAPEALEMTQASEAAGVKTQVGFNYICNPMLGLAREMIQSGEIGEVRAFRGLHAEDFMVDAAAPFGFRHEIAGGGALADMGSHVLAGAEFLCGPITEVLGDCVTAIPQRRDASGIARDVQVDDITRAFLRFENGATGSLEANWLGSGRKMQLDFEVMGSKGGISFSQERFNELHVYINDDSQGRRGFRRIEAGPEHPPYGNFCPAPGHQIGFNDLKAIEVARFVEAIAGQRPEPFNFRAGYHIQTAIDAIQHSSRAGGWVSLPQRSV